MSVSIHPSIFREYDIRGVYPTEVNEDTFRMIGRAVAVYLSVPEIAVGRDTRLSSPVLSKALIEGITAQGVNVVDLGLISTEIHNFASGRYGFDANIIVSASHNPPEYNGLKILKKGVIPLHGSFGLPEIKALATAQQFPPVMKTGSIRTQNVLDAWIEHARSFIDPATLAPLTVVVDAGNGMGGISWEKLEGLLPIKIIPLFFEPDGRFPNHLPDPLTETNLQQLKDAIIKEKADCGIALDGDADRMFALDEKGNIISGTIMTAFLAEALLANNGPAPVLYNVVCGRIVPETITKFGGTPIRVRVGHSFIKAAMREHNGLFAGEHSGHFYFRDNFFADSSLIAGLLFLSFLSQKKKPASDIVATYEKYVQSGERNYEVADVSVMMKMIEDAFPDVKEKDSIDGLSLWYETWWCNIRSSKTEPLLRVNVEADTKPILTEALEKIHTRILSHGGHIRGGH